MLNALEPGTVIPIHRHCSTSETVVILRGRAVQWLYDAEPKPGNKHQAKFEKMLGMQYSCPGIGDVRLMVGVRKRDKTKFQYCITSLTPTLRTKKKEQR